MAILRFVYVHVRIGSFVEVVLQGHARLGLALAVLEGIVHPLGDQVLRHEGTRVHQRIVQHVASFLLQCFHLEPGVEVVEDTDSLKGVYGVDNNGLLVPGVLPEGLWVVCNLSSPIREECLKRLC